jgi:hypothetical protein
VERLPRAGIERITSLMHEMNVKHARIVINFILLGDINVHFIVLLIGFCGK